MTGLLVLALFGLWVWAVFKFGRWVGGQVQGGRWRWPIAALVLAALLPLPVIDEIIGGFQFKAMCNKRAVLEVSAGDLRGKVLTRASRQSFPAGSILRIEQWDVRYADPNSNIEAIRYSWLRVSGGWLVRSMMFSDGANPLLIDPSTCQPSLDVRLEDKHGFSLTSK